MIGVFIRPDDDELIKRSFAYKHTRGVQSRSTRRKKQNPPKYTDPLPSLHPLSEFPQCQSQLLSILNLSLQTARRLRVPPLRPFLTQNRCRLLFLGSTPALWACWGRLFSAATTTFGVPRRSPSKIR